MQLPSIVYRLIIYIVLFSSFITLAITSIQLYFDYQRDIKAIQSTFDQIQTSFLDALVFGVWSLDGSQVQIQIDGLLRIQDVEYLEVEGGQFRWQAGAMTSKDNVTKKFPLHYVSGGGTERYIGELTVVAGLDGLYWRLAKKAVGILVSNGVKTFLVAGFIVFIFQRMITRHLLKLGRFMSSFSPDEEFSPLALDRAERGAAPQDELDQLVADVNSTYHRLCENTAEMQKSAATVRRSEAFMRGVMDNIADAVVTMDPQGEIQSFNSAAESMFGYSATDAIGKNVSILMPEPDRANQDRIAGAYVETVKDNIFGGGPREVTAVRKDGDTFPMELIVGEMTVGDRTVFIGAMRDISRRKQQDDQLRQSQKMEAIGQLTGGIAHDFNNMLAVIQGNAELLEDEIGEGNTRLAAVFHGTERAADLTQRLLAFSRKQVLRPEVIDANKLIVNITGLLHRIVEEHIDIETVTAAGLWNCEVDPAQLENAVLNLAINARDAMPDGGRLTIETANVRLDDEYAAVQGEVKPGQYVMLAVADNGSGMPPEVREHVFEPFFTTKGVGKGSGLGLSMVYGFVKQSGGNVTIYSEPGEGTTIKLYLPRSTETKAVERKTSTDEVPTARGETVLVVEDDPDVRTLAVALLSSLGYQIMEAATGMAALEQLATLPRPTLLLTDVVLRGDMNGRELAIEVKRRIPEIEVLYMSGYTENGIVHHGRLDADSALLQKPFRRADLARAVRRALDGPSA